MYANAYNKNIANRLKDNDKKLIQHQEESNKMTDTSFTSHLEGMALRDEDVVGGSGYAEATVRDEGFEGENTEGARGSGEPNDPPAKKTRKPRKSKEVGGAILGLAEIETDPRGDPSLKAPLEKTAPSASKEHTQTAPVTKNDMPAVGSGRKNPNRYRALVKEIMEKHKLKLPEAAKFIKEHNLYVK